MDYGYFALCDQNHKKEINNSQYITQGLISHQLTYLEPLHGAVVALPVVRRLGDQLQVLVAERGGGVAAVERRPQARGGDAAPRQLRDVEVEGVLEQEQEPHDRTTHQ